MARIRLIALDLDGTTLGSDRLPAPGAVDAVTRARAAGLLVVLASGRIADSVRAYRSMLGADPPFVASNGAYAETSEGDVVLHLPVDDRVRDGVLAYAAETGVHVNVYRREGLAMRADSRMGDLYLSRVTNLVPTYADERDLRAEPATKLMLVDDPAALPGHEAALRARLPGAPFATVYSEPEYLEFLNPEADKANGLRALGRRLGVDLEEMAAIGDYWNDAGMLATVGVAATLANAPEDLRRRVGHVFSANDEGGVSEFIDWIVYNHGESACASGPEITT